MTALLLETFLLWLKFHKSKAAKNIRSFVHWLLPSNVDCLLRTFACHTFHKMRMRTTPDDSVSHFKVLIVRTVMAISSSTTVVSDVWEFFEKNTETKKVKFSVCSKQLILHEGTTNLCDHLLKVYPLRYKKSKAKQKWKWSSELWWISATSTV